MNKKEKQPKTALGAVVVDMPKNENVVNADATQAQEQQNTEETAEEPKTLDQVMEENERLRTELRNQPKTLEEKIRYVREKDEFITQLSRIEKKREALFSAFELVTEQVADNEFFTENFSLNVTHKPSAYGKEEEVFKLNNPVIIGEVLQFAISRLELKRDELRFLIEA